MADRPGPRRGKRARALARRAGIHAIVVSVLIGVTLVPGSIAFGTHSYLWLIQVQWGDLEGAPYQLSDFRAIRAMGYDGVELVVPWSVEVAPGVYNLSRLSTYLSYAQEVGLEVVTVTWYGGWTNGCPVNPPPQGGPITCATWIPSWITSRELGPNGEVLNFPSWWNASARSDYFGLVNATARLAAACPCYLGSYVTFGYLDYPWEVADAGYSNETQAYFRSWGEGSLQDFRAWSVQETFAQESGYLRAIDPNGLLFYYYGGGPENYPASYFSVAQRFDGVVTLSDADGASTTAFIQQEAQEYQVRFLEESSGATWTQALEARANWDPYDPWLLGGDFFDYSGSSGPVASFTTLPPLFPPDGVRTAAVAMAGPALVVWAPRRPSFPARVAPRGGAPSERG